MEKVLRHITGEIASISHLILGLDVLSRRHPEVRTRLMANLAREMAARLRSADAEIRTLEE